MFEPAEEEGDNWWAPRGNDKKIPDDYRRSVPLEYSSTVEALPDSTIRFVVDSNGMHHQLVSSEPLGHSRLSLHQNHYSAAIAAGSTLGSIDFNYRDHLAASFSSFVDAAWTPDSHPAGLSMKITEPGSTVPRYPAMTMRADGRVAFGGGPASFGNSQVSLGVYRKGILELPSVDRYEDLLHQHNGEKFVNGAIVYAKDIDRVLISQNNSWQCIVTTKPPELPPQTQHTWTRRQVGEPRKDGLPTIFGPRVPYR